MTNLTIGLPDELARGLEGIAAAQHKSLQQLALDHLTELVRSRTEPASGSPAALLAVMHGAPHLTVADADELDAAIAAGRLAVRDSNPFAP